MKKIEKMTSAQILKGVTYDVCENTILGPEYLIDVSFGVSLEYFIIKTQAHYSNVSCF